MDHQRFLATRRSFSWIQKYIFPGGIIPSLQAVDDTLAAHTTLRVTRQRELRPHYARTLRLWRERFLGQWPPIHAHGFDQTFRRMWEFYLAYSRKAGFRSGYLGVSQLQLTGERHETQWQDRLGRRRIQRNRRRRGTRTRMPWRDRSRSLPAARSSCTTLPAGTCSSSRRRHRRRLHRGRRSTSPAGAGPDRPRGAVRGLLEADGPSGLGHRRLRPAPPGQPHRHEQRHRGRAARHAAAAPRRHRRHRLRRRIPRAGRLRSLRRDKGGTDQPARVPARAHRPAPGCTSTTICPGFVRTDLTAGNPFPMPFIIDADQAARSICDGLERERTEIAFPTPMALLMKTARLVPARAWTALWKSTSLPDTRPAEHLYRDHRKQRTP